MQLDEKHAAMGDDGLLMMVMMMTKERALHCSITTAQPLTRSLTHATSSTQAGDEEEEASVDR